MIRFSARGQVDYRKVMRAMKRAEVRGITHAAAALRLRAARSIKVSPRSRPSAPGSPPRTRRGLLPKSILYALLEEGGTPVAVVGPSFNLVGLSGKAHEFGGAFRGADYPARPYMKPALSVIANRLPAFFVDSVKES
jgi:hypothetical protein